MRSGQVSRTLTYALLFQVLPIFLCHLPHTQQPPQARSRIEGPRPTSAHWEECGKTNGGAHCYLKPPPPLCCWVQQPPGQGWLRLLNPLICPSRWWTVPACQGWPCPQSHHTECAVLADPRGHWPSGPPILQRTHRALAHTPQSPYLPIKVMNCSCLPRLIMAPEPLYWVCEASWPQRALTSWSSYSSEDPPSISWPQAPPLETHYFPCQCFTGVHGYF